MSNNEDLKPKNILPYMKRLSNLENKVEEISLKFEMLSNDALLLTSFSDIVSPIILDVCVELRQQMSQIKTKLDKLSKNKE